MARTRQRRDDARRTPARGNARTATKHRDNEGIIPILARAVREVENDVERGRVTLSTRNKFQVIALLVREERASMKTNDALTPADREKQLTRLDGIATILAKTAARQPSLFELLAEDAEFSSSARALRREMLTAAGDERGAEPEPEPEPVDDNGERQVVPPSVVRAQLSNPFLVPDFTAPRRSSPGRLTTWELLGPLFRSFEYGGDAACLDLPEPLSLSAPGGMTLMHHQAQMVESARMGHRTYLLADEPGLGKTAQALLAAQAANAYPLLVVVPNVVKNNWVREAGMWTPSRTATVIHGDGVDIDGFADIVVVNYEVLDRHVGWLGQHGFRGMVVDEAHFIKNKTSQRSRNTLQLSRKIRERMGRPLLMALTGTPLINDIEDFRAIWEFLGWIDDKKPLGDLMLKLEDTGMTPADKAFYPAARRAVVDMGIVRRRKVDVAADLPERRIADLPVELDDEASKSIRHAEEELTRRLLARYESAMEARRSGPTSGIDDELIRRVAEWEREDSTTETGDNVFAVMRRIGQAKALLAADYAAQLARSAGKVVLFAKHIDVMDRAEELFAQRGIGYSSIRGNQTNTARQHAVDSFWNDPETKIVVCSLTAAGVGINLQVASNVVLAELSWTDAEQTQAIDRVHRIGQDDPVTAWRIIAAQTIDARIADLIDSKAGLAARALDGSDEEIGSSADVQLEALVVLLTDALERRYGR